jgi:transcriptional regulator with XRE-family HTH domain
MTNAFYPSRDISATGNPVEHIPQGNATFGMILRMNTPPIREVLATNIRHYMREVPAVDTQVKLAKKAGISQSSVARVLAANIDTQISIVAALAEAIGVRTADLLVEAPAEKNKPLLDLRKLAMLPKEEQEKIKSFADYVFSQAAANSNAQHTVGASFEAELKPSAEEKSRAKRLAQRPLSNDSLSIEPHDQSSKSGSKRRQQK